MPPLASVNCTRSPTPEGACPARGIRLVGHSRSACHTGFPAEASMGGAGPEPIAGTSPSVPARAHLK